MKIIYLSFCILLPFVSLSSGLDHYVRFLQRNEKGLKNCLILDEYTLSEFRGYNPESTERILARSKPAVRSPVDSKLDFKQLEESLFEIYGGAQTTLNRQLKTLCDLIEYLPKFSDKKVDPEIVKIVDGGNQENRIDVVFMGDGYTASERQKFFDDIQRLTADIFEGETFRSYLPVFNIWAIYVESVDSGIGYDGPLDTPFMLYREAGQLRGIYPGNANYARQVCRLTGISGCDYPSLIGNDDYYGGLGGEFVISTKSNRTGTVVLRHEMGHNFVDVGEEYDGGSVYSGVNSATSVNTLGWGHWLSGEKREERAIYRLLEYPWHDLSEGPIEFPFNSDGTFNRWLLTASVSAAGEEDSLEFSIDNEILPWKSTGFDDREFYEWFGEKGFSSGNHVLRVASKTQSTNPKIPRMIASVDLHEFGNEEEFHEDNSYISAYPTFDWTGRKYFRPTNAGCLMRNMTHKAFCNVCREGMWYQFLQKIQLIDQVNVSSSNPEGFSSVSLETLKLGQLRNPNQRIEGEKLEVYWFKESIEQTELRDQFTIVAEAGNWSVLVKFLTPEVRSDPEGLLSSSKEFVVNS